MKIKPWLLAAILTHPQPLFHSFLPSVLPYVLYYPYTLCFSTPLCSNACISDVIVFYSFIL